VEGLREEFIFAKTIGIAEFGKPRKPGAVGEREHRKKSGKKVLRLYYFSDDIARWKKTREHFSENTIQNSTEISGENVFSILFFDKLPFKIYNEYISPFPLILAHPVHSGRSRAALWRAVKLDSTFV